MIIYLAGTIAGPEEMPHPEKYVHVLFSKGVYNKKDFQWLKRRKKKELKNEAK